MREVRTKEAVGDGAGNGVAINAGGWFEDLAPVGNRIGLRRLPLLLDPLLETARESRRRRAAAFWHAACRNIARTGPTNIPVSWGSIHMVGVIGNQVGFAGQARNPEAVIGVGGKQADERWRGMGADR